ILPGLGHAVQFRRFLHEDFSHGERSQHGGDGRSTCRKVGSDQALGLVCHAFLPETFQGICHCGEDLPARLGVMPGRGRAQGYPDPLQDAVTAGVLSLLHSVFSTARGKSGPESAVRRGTWSTCAWDRAPTPLIPTDRSFAAPSGPPIPLPGSAPRRASSTATT